MAKRDISLSYKDGSVITGADAILESYEIALFTVPGEFSPAPDFGIGIEQFVGEVNNDISAKSLRQRIISQTKQLFPEISINSLKITRTDVNTLTVNLEVTIIPYSQRRVINKLVGN